MDSNSSLRWPHKDNCTLPGEQIPWVLCETSMLSSLSLSFPNAEAW